MTNKQIVEEFLPELEHFIEQGGWPIRIMRPRGERICRKIPALQINNDGLLQKDPSCSFNEGILAEYYKFKYKESVEMYDKLYNKVAEIAKEF